MDEITGHDGVFVIMQHDVQAYVNYFSPQVLRWIVSRFFRKFNFSHRIPGS